MKQLIITLLLLALTFGCSIQFTTPTVDAETHAILIQAGARRGMMLLFSKNPTMGAYICPVIDVHIMPALQVEDCADIQLKDMALSLTHDAAMQYCPDYEQDMLAAIALLDSLFKPEVGCSADQLMYLRAFFAGIQDACHEQAEFVDAVLSTLQPEEMQ